MTPEEAERLQSLGLAQLQQNSLETQNQQQAISIQESERNMIKDQLDLGEELVLIENLLRGNILKKQEDGTTEWTVPEDKEMILLSEYGIQLIMNTIHFYLNKNTLLSNYDEVTINVKMEDFATDLADTVFMEYEKVFQYPTMEHCEQALEKRIEKATESRHYAGKIKGGTEDKEDIRQYIISEMDIERELDKEREKIMKNKLKRFLILIREIQDAVHSAYLRALAGAERRTLRQHIHISESRNPYLQQEQQKSKWGIFGK